MRNVSLLLATALSAGILYADAANMTGSWWLNPKRSRWGDNKHPPNSVAIQIWHNEPSLKYSGTLNRPGEDAPVKFEFDGAIDGKEYAAKEDQAERRITFRRKSDRVVESVSKLPDGKTEEHSTLTLSSDGKTIERRMELRSGDQVVRRWVEIYEKRE